MCYIHAQTDLNLYLICTKMIRVCDSRTIHRILSTHQVFRASDELADVILTIHNHAYMSRVLDIMRFLRPVFEAWISVSVLHPKPTVSANSYNKFLPVCEFLYFHRALYVRNRYCFNVTFATVVLGQNNELTGVVWTRSDQRARLFNIVGGFICVVKVLNRQHDPYLTWKKHLRGDEITHERNQRPEYLFKILVPAYFGTHPLAGPVAHMARTHFIWDMIRMASDMSVTHTHPERFRWKRLYPPVF